METHTINEIDDAIHLHEMLPKECIAVCSCSGDNYAACEEWVEKLGLNIPREKSFEILKEVGAWDDEELQEKSDHELNVKVLWIAAGYED